MKDIVRPNGDILTEWFQVDSQPHYSVIDDDVKEPEAGDANPTTGAGTIIAGKTVTPADVTDRFNMTRFDLSGKSIYKVKVWVRYIHGTASSLDLYVNVKLGTWLGEKTLSGQHFDFVWESLVWENIDKNQSDLDNMEIEIRSDDEFPEEEEGTMVDVIYAEIYYSTSKLVKVELGTLDDVEQAVFWFRNPTIWEGSGSGNEGDEYFIIGLKGSIARFFAAYLLPSEECKIVLNQLHYCTLPSKAWDYPLSLLAKSVYHPRESEETDKHLKTRIRPFWESWAATKPEIYRVLSYMADLDSGAVTNEKIDLAKTSFSVSNILKFALSDLLLIDSEFMKVTKIDVLSNLNEDLDASETDVDVSTGTGSNFSVGDIIQIDFEQMYIESISTDTLTVIRGYNNTTATTHSNGTRIYSNTITVERGYYKSTVATHLKNTTIYISSKAIVEEYDPHYWGVFLPLNQLGENAVWLASESAEWQAFLEEVKPIATNINYGPYVLVQDLSPYDPQAEFFVGTGPPIFGDVWDPFWGHSRSEWGLDQAWGEGLSKIISYEEV